MVFSGGKWPPAGAGFPGKRRGVGYDLAVDMRRIGRDVTAGETVLSFLPQFGLPGWLAGLIALTVLRQEAEANFFHYNLAYPTGGFIRPLAFLAVCPSKPQSENKPRLYCETLKVKRKPGSLLTRTY
ncbi:MAG: hypothetical protein K6U80_20345 [Firmicutes bacterium]|nr:hypothetical protein [Bacillota bacterium]